MSTVSKLMESENLGKLISAQRSLDKASALFDEVFDEEGAPNEREEVQEAFYDAKADCEKKIERMMGAVVYHELFYPSDKKSSTCNQ